MSTRPSFMRVLVYMLFPVEADEFVYDRMMRDHPGQAKGFDFGPPVQPRQVIPDVPATVDLRHVLLDFTSDAFQRLVDADVPHGGSPKSLGFSDWVVLQVLEQTLPASHLPYGPSKICLWQTMQGVKSSVISFGSTFGAYCAGAGLRCFITSLSEGRLR